MADTPGPDRIAWIDCAKGLAMLLVIFGHTVQMDGSAAEQLARGLVFSFHMPLFFILSCLTFRLSENPGQFQKKTRRAFRHLIPVTLLIYLLRTLADLLMHGRDILSWKSYVLHFLATLFWASGVDVPVCGRVITAWGMMWFLVVLFLGRTLFDFLHLRLPPMAFYVSLVLCTAAGLLLGLNGCWLPLSLDIALAVMPFFWFGNCLQHRGFGSREGRDFLLSLLLWLFLFFLIYLGRQDYLELAARRYPLFPLCFLGAAAGTMALMFACRKLVSFGFSSPLVFLGRYSLDFFFVHSMDYLLERFWHLTLSPFLNALIRILMDILLCFLLIRVKNRLIQKRSAEKKASA